MINNLISEKDDVQDRDSVEQFTPEDCEREYWRIFGVEAIILEIQPELTACTHAAGD